MSLGSISYRAIHLTSKEQRSRKEIFSTPVHANPRIHGLSKTTLDNLASLFCQTALQLIEVAFGMSQKRFSVLVLKTLFGEARVNAALKIRSDICSGRAMSHK
jgi:hypothetical protein